MKNKINKSIWGILLFVLLYLISCATPPSKQLPYTSGRIRANLGTIGVVSASFQPEVRFQKPLSKGAAALHGAGRGALIVIGTGAQPNSPGGLTPAGAVVMASAPVVGAVIGGIAGVVKGVSPKKTKESEDALKDYLAKLNFQETMRERFLLVAREQTQYPLVPIEGQGPKALDEKVTYDTLSDNNIDTVLEMSVRKCDLQGIKGGINPPLHLVMAVGIRLIQIKDGYVLCNLIYEYESNPRKFLEWGANNAQAFREELDRAFQYFAMEILRALPPL